MNFATRHRLRRSFLFMLEADKGGGSGGAPPIDPPPIPHAGDDTSKSIFAQQRQALGLDQPPPAAEPTPPADAPPAATDTPPKSTIPADVLDPDAPTKAKVPDQVAEILAAELPKNAKKEQIESFGKLKTKSAEHLTAALNRVAELEKQIAGATSASELEELRTKLGAAETKASQIEEEFSRIAFEKSPRFQAQFTTREQTAIELASSYLDGTEVKPDVIELAARATGRKRIELLKDAGIEDATISAILPHLATFDTIQREKKTALDNWKTESKQWQEEAHQRTEAEKRKRVEQENKVWDSVVSKTDLLPLRKSKDNADWNNRAEELVVKAKQIFNGDGADLPTFGETILKGVAYDVQQQVIEHLKSEVSNLRAENTRLKSATPGGGMGAGSGDGAPVDTSKMSREDQAKATFNAEKAKAGAA